MSRVVTGARHAYTYELRDNTGAVLSRHRTLLAAGRAWWRLPEHLRVRGIAGAWVRDVAGARAGREPDVTRDAIMLAGAP